MKRERLLSLTSVQYRVGGRSRTTIWRDIRKGEFPKPAVVGGRVLWAESEVDHWITKQLDSRSNPKLVGRGK